MKIFTTLLIIVYCTILYSQTTFVKQYQLSIHSSASSVIQTYDGNYVLTGEAGYFNLTDIFLLKLDQTGEILWTKNYDATQADYGKDVQETDDKGFIIVGMSLTDTINGYDICLLKMDSLGNTIWRMTYDIFAYDFGLSVKQTSDKGYIITGSCGAEHYNSSQYLFLLKTNEFGEQEWINIISNSNGGGSSVIISNDNCYIVTGYTFNEDEQSSNLLIIKFNQQGDTLWAKEYGGYDNEIGMCIQQINNNDLIVGGYSQDTNELQNTDSYFIKTDQNGDSLWAKTLGSSKHNKSNSVCVTIDSCFVFTGNTDTEESDNDVLLLKMTLEGDTIWKREISASYSETGHSIKQTFDKGFFIGGVSNGFQSETSVLAVKTDKDGLIYFLGLDNEIEYQTRIFPNPCTDQFSIESKEQIVRIDIYDVTGNLRFSENQKILSYNYTFDIDKNKLEKGLYLVTILSETKRITKKIIIN